MYHFQVHTEDKRFKEELDQYAEKGFRTRSEYLVFAFIMFAKTAEERKNEVEETVWKYMQTEEFRSMVLKIMSGTEFRIDGEEDIFT